MTIYTTKLKITITSQKTSINASLADPGGGGFSKVKGITNRRQNKRLEYYFLIVLLFGRSTTQARHISKQNLVVSIFRMTFTFYSAWMGVRVSIANLRHSHKFKGQQFCNNYKVWMASIKSCERQTRTIKRDLCLSFVNLAFNDPGVNNALEACPDFPGGHLCVKGYFNYFFRIIYPTTATFKKVLYKNHYQIPLNLILPVLPEVQISNLLLNIQMNLLIFTLLITQILTKFYKNRSNRFKKQQNYVIRMANQTIKR